jgi:hypothetical protein
MGIAWTFYRTFLGNLALSILMITIRYRDVRTIDYATPRRRPSTVDLFGVGSLGDDIKIGGKLRAYARLFLCRLLALGK